MDFKKNRIVLLVLISLFACAYGGNDENKNLFQKPPRNYLAALITPVIHQLPRVNQEVMQQLNLSISPFLKNRTNKWYIDPQSAVANFTNYSEDEKKRTIFLHTFAEAGDQWYTRLARKKEDSPNYTAVPAFLFLNKQWQMQGKYENANAINCQLEIGDAPDGYLHRFLRTTRLDKALQDQVQLQYPEIKAYFESIVQNELTPSRSRNTELFRDNSFVVINTKSYVQIFKQYPRNYHDSYFAGKSYHLFLVKLQKRC